MNIDARSIKTLQNWFPDIELEKVRLVEKGPVSWYVRSVVKQGAMTIGPCIFYGRARFDPSRIASVALLAHELHHVRQYRERGYVRFLTRYFWDLAGNRFRYARTLPLEAEAYAVQKEVCEALKTSGLPTV